MGPVCVLQLLFQAALTVCSTISDFTLLLATPEELKVASHYRFPLLRGQIDFNNVLYIHSEMSIGGLCIATWGLDLSALMLLLGKWLIVLGYLSETCGNIKNM